MVRLAVHLVVLGYVRLVVGMHVQVVQVLADKNVLEVVPVAEDAVADVVIVHLLATGHVVLDHVKVSALHVPRSVVPVVPAHVVLDVKAALVVAVIVMVGLGNGVIASM